MNKFLLIDHRPTVNKNLLEALMKSESDLIWTTDAEKIKSQLLSTAVEAVFIRIELWNYTWFLEAIAQGSMPELVLLGPAGHELAGCCGMGMPHFLADDCTEAEVESVMRYINSSFLQAMDFRFVLARDNERWFKVDIREISKLESKGNGTVVTSTCGVFTLGQGLKELEVLVEGLV